MKFLRTNTGYSADFGGFRFAPALFLLFAIGVAMISRDARAQQSQAGKPHPAVVRIIAKHGQIVSYGSGTLIAKKTNYGFVMTNWHVVRDTNGCVQVRFPDKREFDAAVVAVDDRWDLALLVIAEPKGVEPVPISATIPRKGDNYWVAGYRGDGTYRIRGGRCLAFQTPEPDSAEAELIDIGVPAESGDSGGPVFNSRSELAGVLFGSDNVTTVASHCGRVIKFLEQAAPHVASLPTSPERLIRAASLSRQSILEQGTKQIGDASAQETFSVVVPPNSFQSSVSSSSSSFGGSGLRPRGNVQTAQTREITRQKRHGFLNLHYDTAYATARSTGGGYPTTGSGNLSGSATSNTATASGGGFTLAGTTGGYSNYGTTGSLSGTTPDRTSNGTTAVALNSTASTVSSTTSYPPTSTGQYSQATTSGTATPTTQYGQPSRYGQTSQYDQASQHGQTSSYGQNGSSRSGSGYASSGATTNYETIPAPSSYASNRTSTPTSTSTSQSPRSSFTTSSQSGGRTGSQAAAATPVYGGNNATSYGTTSYGTTRTDSVSGGTSYNQTQSSPGRNDASSFQRRPDTTPGGVRDTGTNSVIGTGSGNRSQSPSSGNYNSYGSTSTGSSSTGYAGNGGSRGFGDADPHAQYALHSSDMQMDEYAPKYGDEYAGFEDGYGFETDDGSQPDVASGTKFDAVKIVIAILVIFFILFHTVKTMAIADERA